MDAGLRPLRIGLKLVGRAVTVAAGDDLMPVLDGLARAGRGDVLVVDGGGSERALAGELFGTEALRRGLAGIVIDGACRDTNQLRRAPAAVLRARPEPARGGRAGGAGRAGDGALRRRRRRPGRRARRRRRRDRRRLARASWPPCSTPPRRCRPPRRRCSRRSRPAQSLFSRLDYEEHLRSSAGGRGERAALSRLARLVPGAGRVRVEDAAGYQVALAQVGDDLAQRVVPALDPVLRAFAGRSPGPRASVRWRQPSIQRAATSWARYASPFSPASVSRAVPSSYVAYFRVEVEQLIVGECHARDGPAATGRLSRYTTTRSRPERLAS